MLILINGQYINPAHIVEVSAHPRVPAVCVILSNGKEIRVPYTGNDKRYAVAQVVRHIETQVDTE